MVSVKLGASVLLLPPVGPQQVAVQTGAGAMMIVANLIIAATTGGFPNR